MALHATLGHPRTPLPPISITYARDTRCPRMPALGRCRTSRRCRRAPPRQGSGAVSYTHLTLPTICSV
eukprot:331150-Rhodomonas_salina.2